MKRFLHLAAFFVLGAASNLQADVDLGEAEHRLGVSAGQAEVESQGHFQTAAQAGAAR